MKRSNKLNETRALIHSAKNTLGQIDKLKLNASDRNTILVEMLGAYEALQLLSTKVYTMILEERKKGAK